MRSPTSSSPAPPDLAARVIDPSVLIRALRLSSSDPRDPIGRCYPPDEMMEDLFAWP